jgi:hypothetical protein
VVELGDSQILDRICEEPITEELSKLVSTAQKKESALEGEINRIQKKYPQPSSSQKPRPNDNRQHSRGENNPKNQVGQQVNVNIAVRGTGEVQICLL